MCTQGGESRTLDEVREKGGVHVIDVDAGHEVFQELEGEVADILLRCSR